MSTQHLTPVRAPAAGLRSAWPALVGLSLVFLFEMLDNSILNVALPTIGRDLGVGTAGLQWVVNAYAVAFGGLMLLFGAVADRAGRRRVMLVGLALLVVASLATALVRTPDELIAVRALMGVAAAMTTPGSIALAFRLFATDALRVRAITLISTVGLVGLALGPVAGGLVLAVAPWQVLLIVNAPVALAAAVGIRLGIPADRAEEAHAAPIDVPGALIGTAAVALALIAPTLAVQGGAGVAPWAAALGAAVAAVLFVVRQRTARHPLLDLALLARPLVSAGLAYKAASAVAVASLTFLVGLQLQLDWHWSPALAAVGMLPQVVVLLAAGPFVSRFTDRVGLDTAAWASAAAVVAGLGVFAAFGRLGYGAVAAALVLVAAGMRVLGVVAGMNVLRGLPADRTSIGSALVDTAQELATGVGVAVAGTVLAAVSAGRLTAGDWTAAQRSGFETGIGVAAGILTALAAALVLAAAIRTRGAALADSREG